MKRNHKKRAVGLMRLIKKYVLNSFQISFRETYRTQKKERKT